MGYGDSDLDPFGPFSGEGPELELDLPAPQELNQAREQVSGQRSLGNPGRREEPPDEPDGLPRRALELAKHGDPPRIWLEIPYAIGVVRRQKALRQKLPMLARVRDATQVDLEVATLELGRALHVAREHPKAKELGTPLRIAKARHRRACQGEEELKRLRAEAQDTLSEQEESIATNARTIRPLRRRSKELQAQIVVYQQDFEAASKVIHDATTELAAMEKSKTPDANRRVELEAKRTNWRVDADAAVVEIEARTPELTRTDAEMAELVKSSAKAQKIIDETEAFLSESKARIKLEGAEAREAFEEALRHLADEAVRLRLDFKITPSAARLARLHFDTLVAHQRELEMHELALTLSYRGAVKRGFVLLGLLCLGVVGWLGYMIVS